MESLGCLTDPADKKPVAVPREGAMEGGQASQRSCCKKPEELEEACHGGLAMWVARPRPDSRANVIY